MKSRQAPPVPSCSPSTGRDDGGAQCINEQATGDVVSGVGETVSESATPNPTVHSPPSDHPSCAVPRSIAMDTVPQNIAMEMVEQVRRNTQLSYELSHTAVATVLTQLKDNVPGLSGVMENILQTLIQQKVWYDCVWKNKPKKLVDNYMRFTHLIHI